MFIETQKDIIINSFNTFISLSKKDIDTNPFRALNLMEAAWDIIQCSQGSLSQRLKYFILLDEDIMNKYKERAGYALNLVNEMKKELNQLING